MAKSLNSLAEMADRFYTLREERLAAQKLVDKMQKEETELKDQLIDSISKSDATGVSGQLVQVTVVTKPQPQVVDWDALYAYISRRKAWDLLQRRLSPPAVQARWEDGKEVPGVGTFDVVSLSVHKL